MFAAHHKPWRRLGASLAGIALYLQLAFASWGMLALAAAVDASDAFAGHALCLAATQDGAAQPAQPADNAPSAPAHHHTAFCCLWHQLAWVQPATVQTPQPVAYARVARSQSGDTPFISGPQRGPGNARAPPILA
jgi:hypothetical protein